MRLHVTGLGYSSGNTSGADSLWDELTTGSSSLRRHSRPSGKRFLSSAPTRIRLDRYPELGRRTRYMDDQIIYATTTALDCAEKMSIRELSSQDHLDPADIGIIMGTAFAQIGFGIKQVTKVIEGRPKRISPRTGMAFYFGSSVGEISCTLGTRGENCAVTTGSCIGSDALDLASQTIENRRNKVVLVGAAEAVPLDLLVDYCADSLVFCETAYEPFSALRTGFAPSNGGAVIGVEDPRVAVERGATPLASITAIGTLNASRSLFSRDTRIDAEYRRLIAGLVDRAHIDFSDIDLVIPTADGDPSTTDSELAAVTGLFPAARRLIYTPNPITGYGISFSIITNIITAVLCLQHQQVPGLACSAAENREEWFVENDTEDRTIRNVLILHRSLLGSRISGLVLSAADR